MFRLTTWVTAVVVASVLVSGCSSDGEDTGAVADSASSAEPQPSRSATSTPSPSPSPSPVEVSPSPPPPPPAAPASLESTPGFVAEGFINCSEATSLIQAMSSADRAKLAELIALNSEGFDIGGGIDVLEGFVAGRGFTVNMFVDDNDQQWTFLVGTGWFRDERTAAQTQEFGQFVNNDGDCGEYSI